MPRLDRKTFRRKLLHAVVCYAAGVEDGSYEQLMDDLTASCSTWQWRAVQLTLDRVDAIMAETDRGTSYQIAKAQARTKGRMSTWPDASATGRAEPSIPGDRRTIL